MRKRFSWIKKNSFIIILPFFLLVIFYPLFLKQQIPFSANLLTSYFNPWAQEKFVGWEQGIPNKPIGMDDLRIFYPQRHFTMQTFLQGQLPLWNPYSFSGNYHIGLSETGVFYPLYGLFFILPQLPAWVILIVIQPIIAAVGMCLFLGKLFKDKRLPIFGGLVFGFSGIVLVRMVEGLSVGHTFIWMPFAFWGIESFLQAKKFRYLIVLTLSLVLSLLAGWFQFTFYICVFSFLYGLFRLSFFPEERKMTSLFIFLPYLFLPLLTLYHLFPAFQTFLASPRGNFSKTLLSMHLMPLSHILTLLFPDFWGNPGSYNYFGRSEYKESIMYIGVVPFIVSLFSFFSFKKNKIVLYFFIAAIFSLFLGLDTPLARGFISLPIPVISSFLPNRIFLITSFSLSVLSAYGLEFLLSKKLYFWQIVSIIVPILITILVTPFGIFCEYWSELYSPLDYKYQITLNKVLTSKHFLVQEKNLIIPSFFALVFFVVLLWYAKWKKQKIIFTIIIFMTLISQFYFAQKYIPWSSAQFVFPQNEIFTYLQQHAGLNRFISTQEGYIPSNIPLYYNIFSPDGVSSMYSQRYGELVAYAKSDGHNQTNIPRIEARIDPSSVNIFLDHDPYILRFLSLEGVKYIVKLRDEKQTHVPDSPAPSGFKLAWENKIWQIYTYNNVLPRYFWTTDYVVTAHNKILPIMFSPKFNLKTVVLEEKPNIVMNKKSEASIRLVSYTPTRVIFTANTNGNGLLFLSDAYAPQFIVLLDGKKTQLLRADYDFRAVAVPAGKHVVTFIFNQEPENVAFILSGLSLIIITVGSYIAIKKRIFTW